jgi:hypothetical protein
VALARVGVPWWSRQCWQGFRRVESITIAVDQYVDLLADLGSCVASAAMTPIFIGVAPIRPAPAISPLRRM